MSDLSPGYKISKKAAILFVLLVTALIALNASLIIQNRSLRAAAGTRSPVLHPGTIVPSLSGKDLAGKDFTLSYSNDPRKVVLLVFSPRCGFCNSNMPNWKAMLQGIDRTYEMNVTPQTMLINSDGKVEKLWIGLLSPDERSDVEQSFSLKLPQITSSNHFSERARLGDG